MRLLNGTPLALALPEAFLYHGASVFTTLRAEGGRPLWLEEHLARLRRHALALGLSYPGDEAFLEDLEALLRAFPKAPCLRLRFTVGEGVRLSEARPYAPLPLSSTGRGSGSASRATGSTPTSPATRRGTTSPTAWPWRRPGRRGPLRASSWTPSATWWTGAARAPSSSGRGRSTSWRGASRGSPGRRWRRPPGAWASGWSGASFAPRGSGATSSSREAGWASSP